MDLDRLEDLFQQLGETSAEEVVSRALEEIAVRLAQTERHHRAGDLTQMRKSARSITAIAEQIGMTTVARVARDVTGCIDMADLTALAAVSARLHRTGERSLHEIWDLQGYSV